MAIEAGPSAVLPGSPLLQAKVIEAFGRVAAFIVAGGPRDQVLQLIVTFARDLVACDLASITVKHRDGGLITLVADGEEAELYRRRRFSSSGTATARVIDTGEAFISDDISVDAVIASRLPGATLGPAMFLPLVVDGPFGALSVFRYVGRPMFTEDEVEMVRALATQASFVIEQDGHRRRKVELERVEEQLRIAKELQESAIQELFSASFALSAVVREIAEDGSREKIVQAIDSLDQAVTFIRRIAFGLTDRPRTPGV